MSTVNEETQPRAALTLTVPETARILIVCDNDSDTERLVTAFREADLLQKAQIALRRVVRRQNPVGSRWSFPHLFCLTDRGGA